MTRAVRVLLLALTLSLLAVTPALGHQGYTTRGGFTTDDRCPTDRKVILYGDVEFEGSPRIHVCGNVHDLREADPSAFDGLLTNDTASSIAILDWPPYHSYCTWRLHLWQDVDSGGPKHVVMQGVSNIPNLHTLGWGDRISRVTWVCQP